MAGSTDLNLKRSLASNLDSLQKIREGKGASWNSLLAKPSKGNKSTVASVDEEQAQRLKEHASTIMKYGDTGLGLAGVDTIVAARAQQQSNRERAHARRAERERRENDREQKVAQLLEAAQQKADQEQGNAEELIKALTTANELRAQELELKREEVRAKSRVVQLMEHLLRHNWGDAEDRRRRCTVHPSSDSEGDD
ncbi:hypothetical protein GPECTOR_211g421 [Gonium pectorale]|uniref:Uncharacterized protein n=1 Tax=Gonium pectorale TaxID=33097 RepID=A0A150FWU1_GONPE|nr:hypothetical protein GPECTOR_211g421 [Gonium pectorale]|eukprot:KXZ42069.1 hypothetical protein GPECTOR_211g421 [Gonium pectorale]